MVSDLNKIESIQFAQPLEDGLQKKWAELMLGMSKLHELPELTNATVSQLQLIVSRGNYSRLDFSGLDASATEEMVAEAIRKSPNLKSLEVSKMQISSQLGCLSISNKQTMGIFGRVQNGVAVFTRQNQEVCN